MIQDRAGQLPQLFADFLAERGLVYDATTQVDLLACALSSQFLLFAGPSGTGKSTAARVLAEFFTPERIAVIDARPGWTAAEDVVGQYSAFASNYVPGPHTDDLIAVAQGQRPSTVIVEETNLSPVEAYLGPVVTTASQVAYEKVSWVLHQVDGLPDPPSVVELGPWPRFYGTVNVDATAQAPAPKVSGRTCVVLLEPPTVDTALSSTEALHPPASVGGHVDLNDAGSVFGDPVAAWNAALVGGDTNELVEGLRGPLDVLATSAGNGLNVVSPRDVQRCVLYMAWHTTLASAAVQTGLLPAESIAESAENAILHMVLPGLSAEQFGRTVGPLAEAATTDGLLARRLARLLVGGESILGVPPDFWASLS